MALVLYCLNIRRRTKQRDKMRSSNKDQVQMLLNKLQAQLNADELWCTAAPAPTALLSKAPFACDTLPLESWLQFLFIPKIQALLDKDLAQPVALSILPIAQLRFEQRLYPDLLTLIGDIDKHFHQFGDNDCI